MSQITKEDFDKKISLLAGFGADDTGHLNGKLLNHLVGTFHLLNSWNNRPEVCFAGLFHAVYGTDGLKSELITHNHRHTIREIIGSESENLVYLYASCDRDILYPSIGNEFIFRDRFTGKESCLSKKLRGPILELILANELEIIGRDPAFGAKHRKWYQNLFNRFESWVTPAAFADYQETFRNL